MASRKYISLRTKLYALICIMVAIAMIILSVRNIYESKKMLEGQISDRTISISEISLHSIQSQFEIWQNQTTQILRSVTQSTNKEADLFARQLIETSNDLVSLQVILQKQNQAPRTLMHIVPSRNKNSDEGIKHTIDSVNFDWLKALEDKQAFRSQYIEPVPEWTNLPYYSIIIPAQTNEGDNIWAFLTTTTEHLSKLISSDKKYNVFVVNKKGDFIYSDTKAFRKLDIFKAATKGDVPVASKIYYLQDRNPYIGAFAWSDDFDIAIIYFKNIKDAYDQINVELFKTVLITIIILLIALIVSYYSAVSLTSKLNKLTAVTQTIASGDFSQRIKLDSNDEIGFLEKSINHMAGQIYKLLHLSVEAAKKEKELLTAKAVQDTFFHKNAIVSERLHTIGSYISADECGGDWWGYFNLTNKTDMVCIADATGHGAPAALITAMAYSFFQTFCRAATEEQREKLKPSDLLEDLNKVFWEAGKGKTTMTLFLAFIDKMTGELIYSNAGHNFPFIFPKSPTDERIRKRGTTSTLHAKYFQMVNNGTPLGYGPDSMYTTKKVNLKSGDKIFLYTDGIIECRNQEDIPWGKTNLLKTLNENVSERLEDVINNTVQTSLAFFRGRALADDITVVMVEYT